MRRNHEARRKTDGAHTEGPGMSGAARCPASEALVLDQRLLVAGLVVDPVFDPERNDRGPTGLLGYSAKFDHFRLHLLASRDCDNASCHPGVRTRGDISGRFPAPTEPGSATCFVSQFELALMTGEEEFSVGQAWRYAPPSRLRPSVLSALRGEANPAARASAPCPAPAGQA